ncbi:hypothetical protein [Panacibacter ginsenosidivorans]|uniref:hypothetical protein n=1 Tax=Panacibacter ginsenosidivorans TaxID=1813871 RepID=UPI001CEF6B48|nr:hypothetical protein [Panacibacter ginsenosidivorans]
MPAFKYCIFFLIIISLLVSAVPLKNNEPRATLIATEKFYFNSFVDCNMAEAWIGDTFRIFPGKYGEDPLWGYAHDLKFADGSNADETFLNKPAAFTEPVMPPNVKPGENGLHGAVWFETVYQDAKDKSGKTLYAVYHNENYPATLPYDNLTGKGYTDKNWPQGLTGATTPAAVCRIGIMKSVDGGRSWINRGIFIEDDQPRMILKPHNTSVTFAGGVGDPSAVANGDYLYLFYGEYGYPEKYDPAKYNAQTEWSGQCISVARIALSDLDNPVGKAKRWNGNAFTVPYDGTGKPIASIQIPLDEGGGPASSPRSKFYWGPSVSWNNYLKCWVMLMAKSEGPSWKGNSIYISFNKHEDLGAGNNSQDWSKPIMLLQEPGHIIWYPSLQPLNSAADIAEKNTCLKLGAKARLFYKDQHNDTSEYISTYIIAFSH